MMSPALAANLSRHVHLAIAVSGGVDSMTLAAFAHQLRRSEGMGSVEMIHAVSPAVPPAATERVRARAEREGWRLTVTGTWRIRRQALSGQSGQSLLFLQDQSLRSHPHPHSGHHRVGRQSRRSRRLPAGPSGGIGAGGGAPLHRSRHGQAVSSCACSAARSRRGRRTAGPALPRQPRRNRARDRSDRSCLY